MKNVVTLTALSSLFALAACHGSAPTPRASSAEADIAMVERAQRAQAPIQPLQLRPVSWTDVRDPAADLHMPGDLGDPRQGDGCSLTVPANGRKPVFVAVPKAALIHEAGGWEMFAADSGSDTVPDGLHVAYSSAKHTLQLAPGDQREQMTVTVHDKYDRVVWQATGEMRCKA